MMRAITLHEPWASLMRAGAKHNETRGVRTTLRGDIAITSAKRAPNMSDDLYKRCFAAFASRGYVPKPEHRGCVLCVVEIYDVIRTESCWHPLKKGFQPLLATMPLTEEESSFGNYEPGRFVYLTRNLRPLREPVPCKGMQAIGWTLPPEVEAAVRKQL